jgi:hypothetical protein
MPGVRLRCTFSSNLFSGAFSCQSAFYAAFLARLQVVRVTLHFFNDVFRLNLAFESTECILQGFTLLQSNFCHAHPPKFYAMRICYSRRFRRARQSSELTTVSHFRLPISRSIRFHLTGHNSWTTFNSIGPRTNLLLVWISFVKVFAVRVPNESAMHTG